jgi:hypothetical protein
MKMVSVYVSSEQGMLLGGKLAYSTLALDNNNREREATYTKQCLYLMPATRKIIFLVQLLRQMRTAGYFILQL